MLNTVDICYSWLELDRNHQIRFSAEHLRGFLGYLFVNDSEFHHHSESAYHYPLIQYKVINNRPCVMGLGDFSSVVFRKISELEFVIFPHEKVKLNNVVFEMNKVDIKEAKKYYRFISPWIALNHANFHKFKLLKKEDKKLFLEKILIGNILSALKGLKIFVDFKLVAEIENLKSFPVSAHENKFQGFLCPVRINILLPNYLGIGKSVSKGYGILEHL